MSDLFNMPALPENANLKLLESLKNFGSRGAGDTRLLNFEQRVLYPDRYPVIKNKDGSVSTHRMAYAGIDDGFIAYPTIVQMGNSPQLIQLDDDQAFEYAMKNGEFRKFAREEEASSYAEGGYKKFWGQGGKSQ